jgi:BRCT domain type II-containing protein
MLNDDLEKGFHLEMRLRRPARIKRSVMRCKKTISSTTASSHYLHTSKSSNNQSQSLHKAFTLNHTQNITMAYTGIELWNQSSCTVMAKAKPQQGTVKTQYIGYLGCTVM